MRIYLVALMLGLLGAQQAFAQFMQPPQPGTTTMSSNFTLSDALPSDAQQAGITSAITKETSLMYDVVNRQCALLHDATQRSCKVVRLNVSANVNDQRAGRGLTVTASANVMFELGSTADDKPASAAQSK